MKLHVRWPLFLCLVALGGALGYFVAENAWQKAAVTLEDAAEERSDPAKERSGPGEPGREKPADATGSELRATVSRSLSGMAVHGRLLLPDNQAVAGAELGLYRGWPTQVWLHQSAAARQEQPESSCVTDATGHFSLSASEAGKFRLQLMGDGYVFAGEEPSRTTFGSEEAGNGPKRRRVMVKGVERLGAVLVTRVASIRGQVTENGRGVPGVEILVGSPVEIGSFRPGGPRVKSGAGGEFFFRSVRPGKVVISTRSPSHIPTELVRDVAPGEAVTGVDLALQVGGFVEGTVMDDRGAPVEGATVFAGRETELTGGVRFKGFRSGESTLTDASGRFRLAGFTERAAYLRATKADFVSTESGDVQVGRTDVVLRMDRHGEVHGVLVDQEGTPIAGSEVSARLDEGSGKAFLPASAGKWFSTKAGEFTLRGVAPGANRIFAKSGLTPHADASMKVQVSPGEVVRGVRLVVPVGATLTVTVVDGSGSPVAGAAVDVQPRLDSEKMVFSTGNAGAEISTRVKSTTKMRSPFGLAKVSRGPAPGPLFSMRGGAGLGQAVTDASGRAVLHGLPAGDALVTAKCEAAAADALSGLVLRNPEEIEVPEKGQIRCRLTMEAGGFAHVTTVDSRGKSLPSTAFVVTREGGEHDSYKTDAASGQVRLGPLSPGRYSAALQRPSAPRPLGGMAFLGSQGAEPGLPGSRESFVVRPGGQPAEVRLVFPILTTVHGTVRDAAGLVQGAQVRLLRRGEHALPFGGNEARSDDDGRFELRGLSAGEYVLEFGRPGAAVAGEVELELHQDQPEHEQNVMIPGASVSLRAIEATGSVGVEGARVALTKVRRIPGGGSERTTRTQSKVMVVGLTSGAGGGSSTFTMTSGSKGVKTDTQGHATVLDLPAGRYQLELTHKRFMRFRKEIEVSKGQALQVGTIKLAQGCSIRGRIKWEVLPAVPTALVQLTDGEGAVQPNGVKVVEGNRFAFAGLRPGLYRVRVRSVLETEWVESDPVQLVVGKTERVNMTMPSKK